MPYSPLGKGFLTGKIDENAKFDSSDFRSTLPRFTPEALKANQALIDLLGSDREAQERDSCSDRARLAAGAEAVDRSDPRHDEAAPPGREHRSGLQSNSRPTICETSMPPRRRSRWKELAIRNAGEMTGCKQHGARERSDSDDAYLGTDLGDRTVRAR